MLKEVNKPEDFVKAKEKIKNLTYEQYKLLKTGRISLSELAIKLL